MDGATIPELRIDLGPAAEAVSRAGRRLGDLLRTVPDPAAPTRGLTWTLGELTAHLAARTGLFAGYIAGTALPEGAIEEIAAHNERQIREREHVAFETNVDAIAASVEAFVAATRGRLGSDPYPWYSGLTLDVATGAGIALAELLVHGYDVARTLRRRWPIAAEDARMIVKASLALAPRYLDRDAARDADVTYRLSIRGLAPVRLRIADQTLTVLPPGPEADCTIRATPAAFVLLGYGRIGTWRAAITGTVVATGRRPWLALRFGRYLLPP